MATTVRSLTAREQANLQPLVRELLEHVQDCRACAESKPPATSADVGESGLCDAGRELYRRWIRWLSSGARPRRKQSAR